MKRPRQAKHARAAERLGRMLIDSLFPASTFADMLLFV